MIAQLEEAKARADEFRGRSSRWQVTLSDGIADLISDTEHDLRDRLRKVQREAESAIDEGDPGPIWDQIAEWLDQRVSAAVSETFVWTNERSRWLSEQVAEEFMEGESTIPVIDVGDTDGRARPGRADPGLDAGRLGAAEKIYIGVRGSYGGVLMVGLATSLVGLTLINPLSLLVGVLVGRRAYREDMSVAPLAASGGGEEPRPPAHRRRHVPGGQAAQGSPPARAAGRARPLRRDRRPAAPLAVGVGARREAGGDAPTPPTRDERVTQLQAQLAQLEALRAADPGAPALARLRMRPRSRSAMRRRARRGRRPRRRARELYDGDAGGDRGSSTGSTGACASRCGSRSRAWSRPASRRCSTP